LQIFPAGVTDNILVIDARKQLDAVSSRGRPRGRSSLREDCGGARVLPRAPYPS